MNYISFQFISYFGKWNIFTVPKTTSHNYNKLCGNFIFSAQFPIGVTVHCPSDPWPRWFSPPNTENHHDLDGLPALSVYGRPWSKRKLIVFSYRTIHQEIYWLYLCLGCWRTDTQDERSFTFVHLRIESTFVVFGGGQWFRIEFGQCVNSFGEGFRNGWQLTNGISSGESDGGQTESCHH